MREDLRGLVGWMAPPAPRGTPGSGPGPQPLGWTAAGHCRWGCAAHVGNARVPNSPFSYKKVRKFRDVCKFGTNLARIWDSARLARVCYEFGTRLLRIWHEFATNLARVSFSKLTGKKSPLLK